MKITKKCIKLLPSSHNKNRVTSKRPHNCWLVDWTRTKRYFFHSNRAIKLHWYNIDHKCLLGVGGLCFKLLSCHSRLFGLFRVIFGREKKPAKSKKFRILFLFPFVDCVYWRAVIPSNVWMHAIRASVTWFLDFEERALILHMHVCSATPTSAYRAIKFKRIYVWPIVFSVVFSSLWCSYY